jgi:hypothetical protein
MPAVVAAKTPITDIVAITLLPCPKRREEEKSEYKHMRAYGE